MCVGTKIKYSFKSIFISQKNMEKHSPKWQFHICINYGIKTIHKYFRTFRCSVSFEHRTHKIIINFSWKCIFKSKNQRKVNICVLSSYMNANSTLEQISFDELLRLISFILQEKWEWNCSCKIKTTEFH